MTGRLSADVARHLDAGEPVILVTVREARGSTPQNAGARMAVTATAQYGTVGGGRLEFEAVRRARAMIAAGTAEDRLDIPLGPAVGQCCGGRVALDLRRIDATATAALVATEQAARQQAPLVIVCGAGHVGTALVQSLAPLPVRVLWCDARPNVFADPAPENVELEAGNAVDAVRGCAPGAAVVVLTHSHALDYAITEAALRRGDLAHVGLIGSLTKRRRFERWFTARGGSAAALNWLVCPIGDVGVADKRPSVIAALTAAELLRALLRPGADVAIHVGQREVAL
jgi:xanthine dehydrogenase accessory protein XdhC